MDLVVKYKLYNVGDAAAVDVTLTETGFGVDDFDIAGGQPAVRLDRLAAGANNTHALVLRPKKYGYFNFTSAEVKYRVSEEDGSEIRHGYSSDPGQGLIIALRDYERQFSAHTVSHA
jgi:translocon-associated protein subunit beta